MTRPVAVLEPVRLLPCGCEWVGRFDGDHPWLDDSLNVTTILACGCEWVGPFDPQLAASAPIVGGFCACCGELDRCDCASDCVCWAVEPLAVSR